MNLTGWIHDPRATEKWLNASENKHPVFGLASEPLLAEAKTGTVVLLDYLLAAEPSWVRGRQGIGDCVSWGFGLAVDVLMAMQRALQRRRWEGTAATEAIYGGARVEAKERTSGGWSDGANGSYAAKWLQKWGALVRRDYSAETGNPDHNLAVYDKAKAKQWGNYGCGGRNDKDALDNVARKHPVRTASLVTSFEEADAAIRNGYPVPVCSNVGFQSKQNNKGQFTRDKDGFIAPRGSWSHCMLFCGTRDDKPGLLCANSWGASNAGPRYPDTMPDAIADCTFWVDAEVATNMLSRWKDSFALSQFDGFKPQSLPDLGFTFS